MTKVRRHFVAGKPGWIFHALNGALFLSAALLAVGKFGFTSEQDKRGWLKLSVVEEGSNAPAPARVQLLDQKGKSYAAEETLPFMGSKTDNGIYKLEEVMADLAADRTKLNARFYLENECTQTTQFYSAGSTRVALPPGVYSLKVFKGPEFRVAAREVEIRDGETADVTVPLSRWINLPRQGWYSSDGHLHIPRPVAECNPLVSKWMQAEDIHVANLLQWSYGGAPMTHTVQYKHGPGGIYQEGHYLLASGQESPCEHFLGHTITLGASSAIHFPGEKNKIYRLVFEEARRQNAISGYAHSGMGGAREGMAIDLPSSLVTFLEVLQARTKEIGDSMHAGIYDTWYASLNLGFRLVPLAGSDYPAQISTVPGRERFYTKVEGPFSYASWLEGIRKGRTFVTNGPLLEFQVNGVEMGGEVFLDKAGPVAVDARVRFDPARERVDTLEVIQNGEVLQSFAGEEAASEISARFRPEMKESSWLAVRVSGKKRDEALPLPSVAHSAPIYVTPKGGPGLAAHPRAKAIAEAWRARLEKLEADARVKANPELREAVQSARKHYSDQASR